MPAVFPTQQQVESRILVDIIVLATDDIFISRMIERKSKYSLLDCGGKMLKIPMNQQCLR